MRYFLILALLAIPFTKSSQEGLQLVYDGTSMLVAPLGPQKPGPEKAIFEREILPVARRYWKDKTGLCDLTAKNSMIVDVATGSFTRPGADQIAILYKYCETAYNSALNGVGIIEGDRVVAHAAYEGAWAAALATLPDIDGNGLSEIVIDTREMNMGEGLATISIMEFSRHSIRRFGATDTETYTCGAEANRRSETYRIYVKVGRNPVFYRETFVQECRRSSPWRKSESLKRICLRTSHFDYEPLK